MANPNSDKKMMIHICLVMGVLASSAQSHLSTYVSRVDFVAAHNAVRSSVGVGPVVWNRTVAGYARAYARKRAASGCAMEHSRGPYGENLAAGWGQMTGGAAVHFWATERLSYDHRSNSCAGRSVCGHYTQIVWRSSVHIGCARTKCGNGWMFVICNYDPPGNYLGERPY